MNALVKTIVLTAGVGSLGNGLRVVKREHEQGTLREGLGPVAWAAGLGSALGAVVGAVVGLRQRSI